MSKLVMMMLAQLATATFDETLAAENSRVILLLDFRIAYDTVDREFFMRLFATSASRRGMFNLSLGYMLVLQPLSL